MSTKANEFWVATEGFRSLKSNRKFYGLGMYIASIKCLARIIFIYAVSTIDQSGVAVTWNVNS